MKKKKKSEPQSSIGKYFAELNKQQSKKSDNGPKKENKLAIDKNKKPKK